jgi:hypothetical protein
MRFPVVRERVRVQGRSGTFLVLSVDRARKVASVISSARGAQAEQNVPLDSILPLAGKSSPDEDPPAGASES